MNKQMRFAAGVGMLASGIFAGCQTARNVAVTGFHVIDAPAAYVRRHVDGEPDTTTTTTTVIADSDSVAPGRVINSPSTNTHTRTASGSRTNPPDGSSTRNVSAETSRTTSKSSTHTPKTSTSSQGTDIPYAKPVPGKPGYVISPFDPNGGYVDVTGYPPGSKAKDPYSKKIFLVP